MSRTKRRESFKSIRRPKTASEKRKVAESLQQGVPVRAKRNLKRLSSSYDDIPVSADYEKFKKSC